MSEKILVPALGESVAEATVSKWLKTVGKKVDSDEPLVELETDKVNVEVPSPSDGVLEKITVKEGDTVEVGAMLGSIGATTTKSEKSESKSEKIYKPPLKDEVKEEKPVYENKTETKVRVKKPKTQKLFEDEPEPLILNSEEESAFILDEEHKENKKNRITFC